MDRRWFCEGEWKYGFQLNNVIKQIKLLLLHPWLEIHNRAIMEGSLLYYFCSVDLSEYCVNICGHFYQNYDFSEVQRRQSAAFMAFSFWMLWFPEQHYKFHMKVLNYASFSSKYKTQLTFLERLRKLIKLL